MFVFYDALEIRNLWFEDVARRRDPMARPSAARSQYNAVFAWAPAKLIRPMSSFRRSAD